jgi:hypothetical protein
MTGEFSYYALLVYVVLVLIIPDDDSSARVETCRMNLLESLCDVKAFLNDYTLTVQIL